MSEEKLPNKPRHYSSFFLTDDFIREAKLTKKQEFLIRIRLLHNRLLVLKGDIKMATETLELLQTPEGIKEERRRRQFYCDQEMDDLRNLDTPEGIKSDISLKRVGLRNFKRQYERLEAEMHEYENLMKEFEEDGKTPEGVDEERYDAVHGNDDFSNPFGIMRTRMRYNSSWKITDDIIREANLTLEQECFIKKRVWIRSLMVLRGDIEDTAKTLQQLQTPDGIEIERARRQAVCDNAQDNLRKLDTPDGIKEDIDEYTRVLKRFKRRYEELNTEYHKFMNQTEEQDGGGKHV